MISKIKGKKKNPLVYNEKIISDSSSFNNSNILCVLNRQKVFFIQGSGFCQASQNQLRSDDTSNLCKLGERCWEGSLMLDTTDKHHPHRGRGR